MRAVARLYRFGATHHVEGVGAAYAQKHAHDYTVEVVAETAAGRGVIVDTDVLDEAWAAHPPLQGRDLNLVLAGTSGASTLVEDLAAYWLQWFSEAHELVRQVTVWEDDERWGCARR